MMNEPNNVSPPLAPGARGTDPALFPPAPPMPTTTVIAANGVTLNGCRCTNSPEPPPELPLPGLLCGGAEPPPPPPIPVSITNDTPAGTTNTPLAVNAWD